MSIRVGFLALLVATGLLAAGCTHQNKNSSDSSGSGASSGASTGFKDTSGKVVTGAPEAVPAAGPSTPLQQRAIVRTGTVSIEVGDVDQAADAVLARAAKVGGRIDGDNRSGTSRQRLAEITVRVPPDALDALMQQLKTLGQETNRTIKGEDVTAAKADVDARVQALRTSVGRLREFLKRSGSIDDLVKLESQLSQRESELESTVGQQRALSDQITLATLTVQLSQRNGGITAAAKHDPSGFGAALGTGWHGMVLGARWVLAVVGYALPFAVLAGLVAMALLIVRRRRRRPAGEPVVAAQS
jgi:hypothetical protein